MQTILSHHITNGSGQQANSQKPSIIAQQHTIVGVQANRSKG
jgi:hypothetical protein